MLKKSIRNYSSLLSVSLMTLFISACEKPVELLWKYQSHSASQSTPALSKHLIVFGTKSGEVHAVSKNGGFKWKMQTQKEVISAPIITKKQILFGSTNMNFYALNHAGRQIWKYTSFDRIKGDPILIDKDVVFGSYDHHLYRINVATGDLIWSYPPLEAEVNQQLGQLDAALPVAKSQPIIGRKNNRKKQKTRAITKTIITQPAEVIPTTEAVVPSLTPEQLKAIEEKQRLALIALKKEQSQYPTDAFSYAKPLLTSNGLIVVGNLDGYLYAINKDTGTLVWRFKTKAADINKGITSSVIEKKGVLYFGANDNYLYALNLKDQKVLWSFKAKDEINSSPIIGPDEQIFFGSRDRKFYALDLKTGQENWNFLCEGPVLSWPVVYKKLVVFGAGDGDGHVYALNRKTGKLFWKFKTKGAVDADPAFEGDRFYISSADRNLYAFQINKQPED